MLIIVVTIYHLCYYYSRHYPTKAILFLSAAVELHLIVAQERPRLSRQ